MPKTKSRAISILSAFVNVPNFTLKDKTLLDQILGLERMRAEYVRARGVDVADDVMLSLLVRALPKALQQHAQLQMNRNSSCDQVRSMVVAYERTTTSWSAGKIHSELGILSTGQMSMFPTLVWPLWKLIVLKKVRKQKSKAKGKTKGKNSPKGKGKGKSDKGKGNHPRMHREQQRPMTNAFTAGNMVTSNVIAGNCMVALTPRI